jgi:hypothetical protein
MIFNQLMRQPLQGQPELFFFHDGTHSFHKMFKGIDSIQQTKMDTCNLLVAQKFP